MKLTMPGGMNMPEKRRKEIARQKGFKKSGSLDTASQLKEGAMQRPGGSTNVGPWYTGPAKKKRTTG
jgi:hypothetical protein